MNIFKFIVQMFFQEKINIFFFSFQGGSAPFTPAPAEGLFILPPSLDQN
jgi:hypothetical protein